MKILIVEDKTEGRYFLETLLGGSGYETISAANGKEALEILRSEGADIIISDILMPVMDGFQFCRQCKGDESLQKIPFIFYTATYVDEKDEGFAYEIGADRFIRKPVEPDAFVRIIREVIEEAEQGKIKPSKPVKREEAETYKLYSERLVQKLEEKVQDFEKSEAKYSSIVNDVLDSSGVGIFILDADLKIIWLNRAMEGFFDLDRDQALGQDKRKLIHERIKDIFEDPKEFSERVLATYDNNTYVENFECHVLPNSKREEYWLEHRSKPIRSGLYKGGRIEHYYDITERKRAAKALEESENRFKTYLESSNEGILVADIHTMEFNYANPAICKVLGYSKEELEGMEVADIHPKDALTHVFSEFKAQATGEKQLARGIPCLTKDGTILHADVNSAPALINGSECNIGFFRDVTNILQAEKEKDRLQDRLQQAQKMEAIGTLAGGIAHDFNNILSAIIGYAELALMKTEDETEISDDIKEVLRGADRAKSLVKQILAFSRQAKEEQKPIQIGLIAKEALKLLRASLPATIDIRQNIQSSSLSMSDPTQIHQIFMNLCTNAAHAMWEKGGILEVTLADIEIDSDFALSHPDIHPGVYIKLTVSDTGHGMTPEVMSRIFDPFFTTKEKGEGTGLGLSVVHGIVRNCGGAITVYSQPGQGTTFTLYFPIIKSEIEEKRKEYGIIPTGSEHILFVDDEKAINDIIKKSLTSLGYDVESRISSIDALELFKAMPDKFDLVITDMTMPQMTGDILAQELMKVRPDIPVIICTGFSEKITKEKAEAMGIKAFLMKPLLKDEIAHTIRRVLDS